MERSTTSTALNLKNLQILRIWGNAVPFMSSETLALIAIIVAAASECIALNPKLRSNSVIQLVIAGLKSAFPKKK